MRASEVRTRVSSAVSSNKSSGSIEPPPCDRVLGSGVCGSVRRPSSGECVRSPLSAPASRSDSATSRSCNRLATGALAEASGGRWSGKGGEAARRLPFAVRPLNACASCCSSVVSSPSDAAIRRSTASTAIESSCPSDLRSDAVASSASLPIDLSRSRIEFWAEMPVE
ncbi:hypothetical protein T492DRAFT_1093436 [Pavlovales sp. CCMP2436]|nr:hypothetical protein T492DRAFT_1093436 [Pavlovales sp. CCMP2436]